MEPLTRLKIIISRSCFHTTCIEYSSRQVGTAMRKVFGTNKKKRFQYNDQAMVAPDAFTKGAFTTKFSNPKRATVLNKLFMKHITDQMATGKHASELLGYGIEISRVKIAPDFKILNVFWIGKGTANDDTIDNILKINSGFLRHELSQLRVMGNVPIIQFVRDKQYAHMRDIDSRLAVADFGEDYVPIDPSTKFQVDTEFFLSLEDDMKKKINELETHHPEENDESPIPPMPQDTLGLNHAAIMDRVKKGMKKSEASHRSGDADVGNLKLEENKTWATFKLNQSVNNDPVSFGNTRSQRSEAFREFLLQRQLLKRRAKGMKNYNPDLEYIKEELNASKFSDTDRFEFSEISDNDFIIEDEQEKF